MAQTSTASRDKRASGGGGAAFGLVLAACFALAACERCGGESGETGAADRAADASGANAPGASASALAEGSRPSPSPSVSAVTLRSRRTSSNPTPEIHRACYSLARARCKKLASCSPDAGPMGRECLSRVVEACLVEYAPKESTVTVAALERCRDAHASASCSDVVHGPLTGCEAPHGTLAERTSCVVDAQCASGFCLLAKGPLDETKGCGVCATPPKGDGGCAAGRCGSHAFFSLDPQADAGLRFGEDCTPSGAPCEPPTLCVGGHCEMPDLARCAAK